MKNQMIWGYIPMYNVKNLFEARPLGGKYEIRIKGMLRRYPDRMELLAYIKTPQEDYVAVTATYKGNLYGPYRVPPVSEFHAERGFYEKTADVELEKDLVAAVKARFAEYIEWRIRRYNHDADPVFLGER